MTLLLLLWSLLLLIRDTRLLVPLVMWLVLRTGWHGRLHRLSVSARLAIRAAGLRRRRWVLVVLRRWCVLRMASWERRLLVLILRSRWLLILLLWHHIRRLIRVGIRLLVRV